VGDALGAAMASNDSIVALNVAAVGLVDARSLFKGLRPPLRALNVANNACAAASWAVLGEAMVQGLRLTSLKVRGAEMGDEGAAALAGGIRAGKSMERLEASLSGLGAAGVTELLEAMGACVAPAAVLLSENKMPSGAAQAAGALRALLRTPVAEIDLSQCGLSGSDGELFADALGGARALARLDLSGNTFGDEAAPRLKAALLKLHKAGARVREIKYGGSRCVTRRGPAQAIARPLPSIPCAAAAPRSLLRDIPAQQTWACAARSVEKLFHMDVMADDFDEAEAEVLTRPAPRGRPRAQAPAHRRGGRAQGGWLPDALDISDAKPTTETLEQLAALLEAAARPPPPSPPSRTKWTRLVHPSVLTGHVSSIPPY
jgi:hypothetical protein